MNVIHHVNIPKMIDGQLMAARNAGRLKSVMSKESTVISPVAVPNVQKAIPPADLRLGHPGSTSCPLVIKNPSAPSNFGSTSAANMKKKLKLSTSHRIDLGSIKRTKTDLIFCSKSSSCKRAKSILGKHQTSSERDNLFKSLGKT